MILPYTDEPTKKLTNEDIIDLKQCFSAYVQDGCYNDARHLLDSVRSESPALADELYQIALHRHQVVID
ncbi:hypothetical protein vBAspABolek_23 [Aeromonas phage vB_AspA_Bolek]|nr:hypothetical protein vBAspABolek_23 [Aeromonas phage vB_AspA_Bolek]